MKKIIALLMLAAIVLTAAACGAKTPVETTTETTAEVTTDPAVTQPDVGRISEKTSFYVYVPEHWCKMEYLSNGSRLRLFDIPSAPKIKDERAFHNLALVLMSLLAIYCVIPFILMLSTSLSSEAALAQGGYSFWPREFSFAAYDYMWAKRETIGRCYLMTIIVTVVGTAGNLLLTSLFAYPLSRKDFRPRNFFAFLLFFTVLFNGGLTASYIVWTRLFFIKNTIWALILPGSLMGAMSVLMVRNYFNANIPYAIIEAALLDGASDLKIYTSIMVPLSKPVMTTIGLFAALGYWSI